ncbi:MAG: hypothetical protein ABR921_04720 [Candidatus Sulfotelmatobacter sp.]|jgi:hypothetical protein
MIRLGEHGAMFRIARFEKTIPGPPGYSEILRIANTQATHLRERSIRPHPRWLIFERFTGRPAVIPGYRVTRKFQQFGTGKMGFAEINSDVLEADFDRADLFPLWLFSDFG